jgi:hypothetical protein
MTAGPINHRTPGQHSIIALFLMTNSRIRRTKEVKGCNGKGNAGNGVNQESSLRGDKIFSGK